MRANRLQATALGEEVSQLLHENVNTSEGVWLPDVLEKAKETGWNQWTARCPGLSHRRGDKNPSLSFSLVEDDLGRPKWLIYCHAGCTSNEVLGALGITWTDLGSGTGDRPTSPATAGQGRDAGTADGEPPASVVAEYEYHDADGEVLYVVERLEPKDFRQKQPHPEAEGYIYNLRGVVRVPYRLPEVLAAVKAGEPVWVVEGEKDVEALRSWGLTATTNSGGARNWESSFAAYFPGADVRIIPDNDKQGRNHAEAVAHSLTSGTNGRSKAAIVKVIDLPVTEKGDLSDWIAVGGTREALETLSAEAEEWTRESRNRTESRATRAELGKVLDELRTLISRYVEFGGEAESAVSALWVAHTYFLDAATYTPYILITSPEKGCGKSILLDVFGVLVRRPWQVVTPSPAVVYRKVEKDCPTLLLDEVDTILGPQVRENNDLKGLLNAGFKRGNTVPRCEGPNMVVRDFKVFCPKALAGIGTVPDTIRDRSIPIRLHRSARQLPKFRATKIDSEAGGIRDTLERLGDEVTLSGIYSGLERLEHLSGREQDIWEPLLEIAEAAGPEWLDRAIAASNTLCGRDVQDQSEGVQLLSDLQDIWEERFPSEERVPTAALLTRLNALEEAPWAEHGRDGLNDRGLARLLRQYDVTSKKMRMSERFGSEPIRGYELAPLRKACKSYLSAPSPEGGTSGTSGTSLDLQGLSGPNLKPPSGTEVERAGPEVEHETLYESTDVPHVPLQAPPEEGEGDRLHCPDCSNRYAFIGPDGSGHCVNCGAANTA